MKSNVKKISRILVAVVSFVVIFLIKDPLITSAESTGKVGRNITYTYDDSGVLTLSGSGPVYSDFQFPEEVKEAKEIVFKDYKSDSVPKFQSFSNIKVLNIPKGVTTTEYYHPFSYCTSLEEVTLPEGMTRVSYGAFEGCSSLKKVNLPSTITEIDWFAFYGCTSLKSFVVPEGVTELVEDVFRDCTSLENVSLPSTLTEISCFVFYGCTSLKEIVIPDNVKEITWKNFQYCESLEKIVIPEATTTIDADNFDYSDNVKIYGYKGSYAEEYAKETGIEFVALPNKIDSINLSYTSVTYNGKVKQPKVIVKDTTGAELVKNTDYTVTYAPGRINAGTYKVTVKGIGSYSFTKELTFTIKKADMKVTVKDKTAIYNGKGHKITVIAPEGAKVTYSKTKNGTYSKTNPQRVSSGTTTVYYKVTKENYNTVTGIAKVTVNKKSISKATLSKTTYVYNGNARKPSVTVKNSSGTILDKGEHYTVTYKNNTKVGTATVTINGIGNYKGKITKEFKINPMSTTISGITSAKKAFTVKWKKITKQTTGYQIMYATNSKFTANKKTLTITNNTTVSKKISSLKAKKYYVKVRSYKTLNGTEYYSSWSSVETVKVK